MANNYTEFSEVVPNLSDEDMVWLKHQLETVYVFNGKACSKDELPVGVDMDDAEWSGYRGLLDFPDRDELCYEIGEARLGCEWSIVDDERGEWGRYLWVYAEEHGWMAPAVHLIQKFLKECRPDEFWSLSFADYCSKPRVGEFGGGAVFVTAEKVKWSTTYDFVAAEKEKFVGGQLAV